MSEEEQRQRIRELVRKQTGMDWPELLLVPALAYLLFRAPVEESYRTHSLLDITYLQLELTDEEAKSIGV